MEKYNTDKFTITHRLLHWLIALFMLLLFITGFLRMEWMSKKTITTVINEQIPGIVTNEQSRAIAKAILAPMWEWHVIAAYCITVVFIVRILYMVIKGIRFPHPFRKAQSTKESFQGYVYILFYILLFIMIITGFYLKFGFSDWKKPMETVHKWAIYWFPIFIILHFVGIFLGETSDKKGVASKMIGG